MTMKLLNQISIAAFTLATSAIPACGDDSSGDSAGDSSTGASTPDTSTPDTSTPDTSEDTSTGDVTTEGSTTDEDPTTGSADDSTDTTSGEAEAAVRVFHAAVVSDGNPDQGFGAGEAIALDVNIDVDGTQVVEGLALYALTSRLTVPAGEHQITVSDAEGNVLFDESITLPEGDSTVIAYNAAADFTGAAELALYPPIEEAGIVGEAGEAGVLAVHLDGNSQADPFLAYTAPFDGDNPEPLGAEFTYQADSGVYSTSDFGFTHLDPDGGADYVFGFTCDTPGSAADGAYILVWGTNSVAPPGSPAGSFSANAFTLTADTAEGAPLTSIGCAQQGA